MKYYYKVKEPTYHTTSSSNSYTNDSNVNKLKIKSKNCNYKNLPIINEDSESDSDSDSDYDNDEIEMYTFKDRPKIEQKINHVDKKREVHTTHKLQKNVSSSQEN